MVDPAEVVVQPFAPQQPGVTARPKLPFESRASDPAELVDEGRFRHQDRIERFSRSQSGMPPANASGAVKEPVGKYQIAKPATGGSQFLNLDVACEGEARKRRQEECGRFLDVRAAEVDFQAADDRSPLPVVAELEAENATLRARTGFCEDSFNDDSSNALEDCRVERRVTPAAAAVDTDIEPDPIGNGAAGGWRSDRRHRPHRYVRRYGWSSASPDQSEQSNTEQKVTSHEVLLIDTSPPLLPFHPSIRRLTVTR